MIQVDIHTPALNSQVEDVRILARFALRQCWFWSHNLSKGIRVEGDADEQCRFWKAIESRKVQE
jgi:hypothetical protein